MENTFHSLRCFLIQYSCKHPPFVALLKNRTVKKTQRKEVEASVKQICSEMNKLVNERNRMVIG